VRMSCQPKTRCAAWAAASASTHDRYRNTLRPTAGIDAGANSIERFSRAVHVFAYKNDTGAVVTGSHVRFHT
jgi:hypothetical protein